MTNIKKETKENKTYYSAKDVFTALGLRWKGIASAPRGVKPEYTKLLGTNQYVLDEANIRTLCKLNKKSVNLFGFATDVVKVDKEVTKLKETVQSLKVVVAQLLTKDAGKTKSLSIKGKCAKIRPQDPLQVQARRQVRQIVQDYASARANELKITGDDRRIFFDLSFKALYVAYREQSQNKTDLKELADKETETTGTKVSGLQIAEKLGLAIELLQFTKAFYKLN